MRTGQASASDMGTANPSWSTRAVTECRLPFASYNKWARDVLHTPMRRKGAVEPPLKRRSRKQASEMTASRTQECSPLLV